MSAPLTIGSLFSGIGGLELGLERGIGNGARTIWQVEQSEYCRAVLAKHWPDATRYDDVRTVGRSTLAPVDVLCGGFPCQDISMAGSGAGIREGTRSGLWFEYARLVGELRPRYVVVENVAAVLVRGRGFDVVLGELAALGYDAWWDCLPAAAVGAPHRRDRLFLLAYPQCERPATRQTGGRRKATLYLADWNSPRGTAGRVELEPRTPRRGADVADAERRRLQSGIQQRAGAAAVVPAAERGDRGGRDERGPWDVEPNVGRLAHGVSRRLVELSLSALGNAVVPQVAEVVGRLIADHEAQLSQPGAA